MTPDPRTEAVAKVMQDFLPSDWEQWPETAARQLLERVDAVDPLRQPDLHARFKALAAAINETTDGMLSILDDMEAER